MGLMPFKQAPPGSRCAHLSMQAVRCSGLERQARFLDRQSAPLAPSWQRRWPVQGPSEGFCCRALSGSDFAFPAQALLGIASVPFGPFLVAFFDDLGNRLDEEVHT